ncbi:hypothetical protein [Spiroplasma endosymbiont of Ammophila pubescens]|uniref:hypothetical protein n=1 Tax=Spiroplasma endosymbiont of Ammophila pubescens TaxID=3066315 RepID=UPI0032B233B8
MVPKIIKKRASDNLFEYKWPNGRIIKVVGFDNGSTWEGQDASVGEYAFFGLYKVIPLDATILDENEYMYRLFNMIIQISRGKNITTTREVVP